MVAESRMRKKITLPDNAIGQSINHLATHSQGDLDQLSIRNEDIRPDLSEQRDTTPAQKRTPQDSSSATKKRKADTTPVQDSSSATKRARGKKTVRDTFDWTVLGGK
ncbi:hypothetical protein TI39_contig426g00019 [Zymoseptoria brevis]|uniref:Uncharacterized protein n=1 Tax=Zymoseptoria brevis TaxID=1047168 RepID=A0A0F4GPU1_9PEZI|nr:hypothetical protein TI39_contig426g00019 [Zymoseptoria brevis]